MAEAGGQSSVSQSPPTYFCYSCSREISQVSPDFTCVTCGSGFIEEVPAGAGNPVAPPPLLFSGPGGGGLVGGAGAGFGLNINPGGGGAGGGMPFFRSTSTGQNQNSPFDLFDIIMSGMPNAGRNQRVGADGGQGTATTAVSPTGTTTTSSDGQQRPHPHAQRTGHFSFVIDSTRPRAGGGTEGGQVTITGSPSQSAGASVAAAGGQPPNPADNGMENMLYSFLNDLIAGLGGQGGANVNVTGGVPVTVGNLGDYVWGRDGLDAIVTQLMNQMEGTGPPPLSEDKTREIPDIPISQAQVDRKLHCSVCWDDFILNEKVKQLECEHLFHQDCIIPWLKLHGTCPICRRDLTDGAATAASSEHPDAATQHNTTTNPTSTSTSTSSSHPHTTTGNNSNPSSQGATNPSIASASSPLSFLASLANTIAPGSGFFSSNPTIQRVPRLDNSSNSNNPNTTNPNPGAGGGGNNDGNTGGGSGGGGHLDLDNMEFDFD